MMHDVGSRKIDVDIIHVALSKLPITIFYWCTAQSQKHAENVSKLNHNRGVSSGYDKRIGFV